MAVQKADVRTLDPRRETRDARLGARDQAPGARDQRRDAPPNGYPVQVLDRVFRILEVLSERPARVGEIGARLGLHRSTVFRLLANLEQRGYVRRDENTATYSLGMKLFQLGTRALQEQFPVHRLRPVLDELAAATGYTGQVWLRSGYEAVCVDQVESPRDFRLVGRVGRRLPLNSGAVGKTLLAFAPPRVIDEFLARPLPRISVRTVADAIPLRAELERIRTQSWALSMGETRVNSWALAAPVYNAFGSAELAVCILAVEDELAGPGLDYVRRAVMEAADRMSTTLGYSPEPAGAGLDSRGETGRGR